MSDTLTIPTTAKPAAQVNPKLIDAVEVSLDGVIGAATMTVAELVTLKAGAVVTLDASLDTAVELRLNGAAVARGELVAVDDRFAIRITEIAT